MSRFVQTRVIVDFTWSGGQPHARVFETGAGSSVLQPLIGMHFNYRVFPDAYRRCLGHMPLRNRSIWFDCRNLPEPGQRKCNRCSIADATFASNLHHAHTRGPGELDPAMKAHMEQPNVLYLAAFRDGSMKVGTSTATRANERLLEQGAWMARVVARSSDGYAVRLIEARVTANLQIPQSVSTGRKMAGLLRPYENSRLSTQLESAAWVVAELIEASGDTRLQVEHARWQSPHADDMIWTVVHRYPLHLDRGNHNFHVVGCCGRIAAVQVAGVPDIMLVDLAQFLGVELTLGEYASGEIAIQDALF